MMKEFFKRSTTALLLVSVVVGACLHSSFMFTLLLSLMLCRILIDEVPRLYPERGWKLFLRASLFPVLPMALLIGLVQALYVSDYYLPCYILLIASVADTAAYIVGSLIGRTKIWPAISPKKTWEGFVGAFVAVVLANWYWLPMIKTAPFAAIAQHYVGLVLYSFCITEAAFLGGMYFSWLKRRQSLKDAGSLLPGHGGLLDRFDSIFAVTLVLCVCVLVARYL